MEKNMIDFSKEVALQTSLPESSVKSVLALIEGGATIPFIARYRKDVTGGMDEVQIQFIQETAKKSKELFERRTFIQQTIEGQGKMTEEILAALQEATTLSALEDIYLPFKPKRKTKAQAAREKGLEPLAVLLLDQAEEDWTALPLRYVNSEVLSPEDALQGARDIVAEMIAEDADTRAAVRGLFEKQAVVESTILAGKEEEAAKYRDYFQYKEPATKIPSHRLLAILRGFMEGFLRITIAPEEEVALDLLQRKWLKKNQHPSTDHLSRAIRDAYRRLLQPAMETELRNQLKQQADEEAIQVFAENLRQLLLAAPLGGKHLLAIDPGYRTGCKVVCLDAQGYLKHNDLIFIHEPGRLNAAEHTVKKLVEQFNIEAIAIGDGTAGRETEQLIRGLHLNLPIFLVNEDGASVYSASETAREEFPDHDVTVRGAVSIGRRLMDPLAELVKIDPKSIGVGQYQHDVNQVRLKERLDQTVVSCVNKVGVNLNTASKHLLSYVSGIGPSLAEQIVQYRQSKGAFSSRQDLLQVPRLGAKAFEQCAGFLRIPQSTHPLDASAVHPEAYSLVEKIALDAGVEVKALIGNSTLLKKIPITKYVTPEIGAMTIKDILDELDKPGLDPRSLLEEFQFASIYSINDVQPGIVVPGVVTNITRFGAFIDIGVKQDGLVHISEISTHYISDPSEVLKLQDKVQVKVLEVDVARKRIALSIKQAKENGVSPKSKQKVDKVPAPAATMEDALSLLRKKFSK
jgi:uncharacterized protein